MGPLWRLYTERTQWKEINFCFWPGNPTFPPRGEGRSLAPGPSLVSRTRRQAWAALILTVQETL